MNKSRLEPCALLSKSVLVLTVYAGVRVAHPGIFLYGKAISFSPAAVFHLQNLIGLLRYSGVVGDDDHGAAVVVGKAA